VPPSAPGGRGLAAGHSLDSLHRHADASRGEPDYRQAPGRDPLAGGPLRDREPPGGLLNRHQAHVHACLDHFVTHCASAVRHEASTKTTDPESEAPAEPAPVKRLQIPSGRKRTSDGRQCERPAAVYPHRIAVILDRGLRNARPIEREG
jgi:hypothetical protein